MKLERHKRFNFFFERTQRIPKDIEKKIKKFVSLDNILVSIRTFWNITACEMFFKIFLIRNRPPINFQFKIVFLFMTYNYNPSHLNLAPVRSLSLELNISLLKKKEILFEI